MKISVMRATVLLLSCMMAATVACGPPLPPPPPGGGVALPSDAPAKPADAPRLAGVHAIQSGERAGGGAYTGSVIIAERGETYEIEWTLEDGTVRKGFGVRAGGMLAASWGPPEGLGIAAYSVRGKELAGLTASEATKKRPGVEDLVGPAELAGTYQIVRGQLDPDNPRVHYGGAVDIVPSGSAFTVSWVLDDVQYEGVGVRRGDVLAAARGKEGTGVVLYEVHDDRLEGVTAVRGAEGLGREVVER